MHHACLGNGHARYVLESRLILNMLDKPISSHVQLKEYLKE